MTKSRSLKAQEKSSLSENKASVALDGKTLNVITLRVSHISLLSIVRERLAVLGLAQIPSSAVSHLEGKLAAQVREIAAKKITVRAVARAIVAAAKQSHPAPKNAEKGSAFPKPPGA